MITEEQYKSLLQRILSDPKTEAFVKNVVLNKPLVFESIDGSNMLDIAENAVVNNAVFNLSSGHIRVEEWAFFGHEVKLLTGTHDASRFGRERQVTIPTHGRDICIGRGAWVGTGAIILGPCTIGENAVVAAGSVVTHDVPPYSVVGGVPARIIKMVDGSESR